MPASLESVADVANRIIDALERGTSVAVHCRQGIGRSSVIVAAVLVAAGETPNDALRTIRESRGLEVPETEEQRRWLTDFASWLLTRIRVGAMIKPHVGPQYTCTSAEPITSPG